MEIFYSIFLCLVDSNKIGDKKLQLTIGVTLSAERRTPYSCQDIKVKLEDDTS